MKDVPLSGFAVAVRNFKGPLFISSVRRNSSKNLIYSVVSVAMFVSLFQ